MQIKAVLFDLDETVLDRSKSLELYLWWESFDYLGLLADDCEKYSQRFVELDDNGALPKADVYSALVKEFDIRDYSAKQLAEVYEQEFSRFAVEKRHINESVSILRSQGLKTGIVSNGRSPFQEQNLAALGLQEYFDTVLVSEAVGCRKPDLEIFQLACTNLDVKASECVFIGDNPQADIQGANNAGMFSVFLPTRRYPACAHANHVCRDLRDLPSVVIEAAEHQRNQVP